MPFARRSVENSRIAFSLKRPARESWTTGRLRGQRGLFLQAIRPAPFPLAAWRCGVGSALYTSEGPGLGEVAPVTTFLIGGLRVGGDPIGRLRTALGPWLREVSSGALAGCSVAASTGLGACEGWAARMKPRADSLTITKRGSPGQFGSVFLMRELWFLIHERTLAP
jgi:hypothetical protein